MGFSPVSAPRAALRRAGAAALLLLAAAAEVHASPETDRGLELIHQGRLREGMDALHAHARAHPGDASAQFYAGVASWWRHIAEFGNDRAAEEAIGYFA
jgi:hypothetical protein